MAHNIYGSLDVKDVQFLQREDPKFLEVLNKDILVTLPEVHHRYDEGGMNVSGHFTYANHPSEPHNMVGLLKGGRMKNNGGILPIFLVLFCATSFFAQEPIMYPASESDDKQCERLIPKIVDATRTLFIFGDSLCTQRDSTFEQDTITAEKAKFSLHSVGEILTQVTVYTTYDLPGGRVVRTEFYTLGTIGDGIWIATVTPHAFGSLPINLTGYMSAVGIRLLKGKYPNGDCCWGPERWTQLSDKWDPDLQTYPSILTPLAYSRYWRFEKDDRKYLENVLDMLLKK